MLVSEQQAISASRQAYVQEVGRYQKEGKLVTDPRALNRVRVITEKLVAQAILMRPDSAEWEWSVQVIDDPKNVNAWCMAGGRMAVYTGLLLQVDPTDDELAFLSTHPSDQQRQARLGALAPGMMQYCDAPGSRPRHPVRVGGGAA
jgi:Zn-dependent protease with chaperone function